MSTPQTQDAYANLKGLPQPKVQELPKMALTGKIVKVGEAVTTREGEGDYDAIELIVEPTNGSRKISFIKMYVRPEFFSFGQLDPEKMYISEAKNPYFVAQKEGTDARPKTNGESFAGTYGMAVMPSFATDGEGNVKLKSGKPYVRRITPVMAIAGGTLEGFNALVGQFKAAVEKDGQPSANVPGITELAPEQITGLLNEFIQSNGSPELIFTARQASRDGQLTDNYEFDQFEGPLNTETHKRILDRAAKTASQTGSKKLVVRYTI